MDKNIENVGELMHLTVAMVLYGLDVAYADDARGRRFFMDLDSQGARLDELRGGARIKARADLGSGWIEWVELS